MYPAWLHGTSALHLSLVEAGVVPGDIVLVPPVTFIAAVNPVKYQFAEPVFIDCDDSLCMDPIKLRRFCDEQCKFKDGQLSLKHYLMQCLRLSWKMERLLWLTFLVKSV